MHVLRVIKVTLCPKKNCYVKFFFDSFQSTTELGANVNQEKTILINFKKYFIFKYLLMVIFSNSI